MIKISDSVIKEMYSHIFLDYEVCANIIINNDRIIFQLINYTNGKIIKNNERGVCQHKNYSNIIYHSHPTKTYSYPSNEDIIKIVRNEFIINYSIIATKWGIWQMSLNNDFNKLNKKYEIEIIDYVHIIFGKIYNNIRNHSILKNEIEYINDNLKLINKELKINIEFAPWSDWKILFKKRTNKNKKKYENISS